MYFIEILNKIFTKKDDNCDLLPENDVMKQIIEEEANCEHVFVPIDKTGKIYGCVKCGHLIKHKPKNKNFFEGEK